ncbi:GNAT family N-acetyltransferase [Micromonospora sp. M12]
MEPDGRRTEARPAAVLPPGRRHRRVGRVDDPHPGRHPGRAQSQRPRADVPHEAAVKHYEQEFAAYSSPREWWRIGTLGEDGEPVGFVVPARNAYHPVIAYLGVVPEHRGHGYVDGLLAEGTRVLAEENVPRIRAATDLGNVPMAKAFARAGYVNFERAINMAW